MKALLKSHPELLNARDEHGETPLFCAAEYGKLGVVDVLVKHGADVNAREQKYGCTPIEAAVLSRSTDIVRCLIAAGADVNAADKQHDTPLLIASKGHDFEMIKLLVAAGADIDASDGDPTGDTPIDYARDSKDKAILRYLQQHRTKHTCR